jgi:sporulation protein YlmC with PRC-barrel domain
MKKYIALALLGTSLAAAPALAQNQPATSNTGSMGAMNMDTGNWMTQEKPGQWRASKLDGLNVYNNNNEKIGDIKEMLLDNSGKVEAVVIGVGGFLGMGEHDVAVPFDQIKFVNEPRANVSASNANPPAAAPGTAAPAGTATTTAPNTTGSVATTTTADNANRSTPDHALLNMTKDQLKAAPEFKYSNR